MSFGSPYNKSARKVLLLGGGELGKELVIELQRLGIETHVCDNKPHSPAGQVAHYSYHINMLDYDVLSNCINAIKPHCIIPEVESFNMKALKEAEQAGTKVYPNAYATEITMNRRLIRDLATQYCRTTEYLYASSEESLLEAIKKIGVPCVVKPLMSSSGKGQSVVKDMDQYKKVWEDAMDGSRGDIKSVIVEKFLDFDYEITLMTILYQGNIYYLDPIGHEQEDGDYKLSFQPKQMSKKALDMAQYYSSRLINELCGKDDEGIFGMEFFVKGDTVYFSEVSPRPHDTAMVTMTSQENSQFKIYSRIICGLPLGNIDCIQPAMSHALIYRGHNDDPQFNIYDLLTNPNIDVRLFGKTLVIGRRRMGVILIKLKNTDDNTIKNIKDILNL
jgi:phosphoribosylglycinamide formyltransferase 2